MDDNLHRALTEQFKKHRIIFWYDETEQQRDSFLSFQADQVEKIELERNEFRVKYQILHAPEDRKFLVYSPYQKPADENNWLMDLTEEYFVFAANQAAGYVQELEIDQNLEQVVADHLDFFSNKRERRDPLKANLKSCNGAVTAGTLLDAMLSALIGEKRREREKSKTLDEMLMIIFRDLVSDLPRGYLKEIEKFGLKNHFLKKIDTAYGYQSGEASLEAILAHFFVNAFIYEKERRPEPVTAQAFTFIDGWRNTWDEIEVYQSLADRFEKELNVSGELKHLSLDTIQHYDLFKENDRIFLQKLITELELEHLSLNQALSMVERRKECYWFKTDTEGRLKRLYGAVELYIHFQLNLDQISIGPSSSEKLWKTYTESLYRIDTLYRKFLYAYREVRQDFLKPLLERIEKRYTNSFLALLSDAWHDSMTQDMPDWMERDGQHSFFQRYVSPLLQDGKIVTVICSDALRFEAGKELAERLARENRVQVDVDPLVSCIPSYTQLGMARLLPHKTVEIDPATMNARCDGTAATGSAGRQKVFDKWFASRGSELKAKVIDIKEFLDLPLSVQQDEIEGFNCVYFYSSIIDSTGDNAKSEQDLPDGVEREIRNLIALIKRIINLNRTHLLITADHGFLFQHTALDENAMIPVERQPGELQRDRRYIVGRDMQEDRRFYQFAAEKLGIGCGFQVQIPRGIVRIRKQGAGSRYVHGGISLQEIAVPVLKVYKSRKDDVREVQFSVLSGTGVITTNQHTVKILQEEPVSSKITPLVLTLRFESKDGAVLSSQQEVRLDSRDENQQNRVFGTQFVFSRSVEKYNNQQVLLCMYRDMHGHLVPVRDPLAYRIQISIAPDF